MAKSGSLPLPLRKPIFMIGYHTALLRGAETFSPSSLSVPVQINAIREFLDAGIKAAKDIPEVSSKLSPILATLEVFGQPDRNAAWASHLIEHELRGWPEFEAGRRVGALELLPSRLARERELLIKKLAECGMDEPAASEIFQGVGGELVRLETGVLLNRLTSWLTPDPREALLSELVVQHAAGRFPDPGLLLKLGCNDKSIKYLEAVYEAKPDILPDSVAIEKLDYTHPSGVAKMRKTHLPADLAMTLLISDGPKGEYRWKPAPDR